MQAPAHRRAAATAAYWACAQSLSGATAHHTPAHQRLTTPSQVRPHPPKEKPWAGWMPQCRVDPCARAVAGRLASGARFTPSPLFPHPCSFAGLFSTETGVGAPELEVAAAATAAAAAGAGAGSSSGGVDSGNAGVLSSTSGGEQQSPPPPAARMASAEDIERFSGEGYVLVGAVATATAAERRFSKPAWSHEARCGGAGRMAAGAHAVPAAPGRSRHAAPPSAPLDDAARLPRRPS
jgi:hypothetical protein